MDSNRLIGAGILTIGMLAFLYYYELPYGDYPNWVYRWKWWLASFEIPIVGAGFYILFAFPDHLFAIVSKGAMVCITVVGEGFLVMRGYFGNLPSMFGKNKQTGIYGNASFMSWWDKWWKWYNSSNHGWSIGDKSIPRDDRVGKDTTYEGLMVLGPPGVGKSSAIAIMSILRFVMKKGVHSKEKGEVNIFTNDPSGELYAKTSKAAQSFGYEVFRLCTNSRDRNKSIRFNPIAWCKDYSDIGALAGILIDMQKGGTTDSTSQYFMSSAKTILTAILTAIWTQALEYQNLPNAYRLLLHYGSDKETIGKAIEQCLGDHETLRLQWTAMQQRPEKELGGAVATAENALAFTGDPTIAFILSGNDFSIDDLRQKKMIFYNQFDENDKHFKPVNALLLSYAFSRCMQAKQPEDKVYRSVMFILEECYTLGYIAGLPEFCGNCRKYLCGIMLILQGLSQIENTFKSEAKSITDGVRSMAIFRGLKPEYYEQIEKVIGYRTDKDENGQERKVPLISVQEIEQMSKNDCIIKIAGEQPIKTTFKKYFELSKYQKLVDMGAVEVLKRDIQKIPYLDFSYDIDANIVNGYETNDHSDVAA